VPPVHRHMSRDLLTVQAALPVHDVAQRMADRDVGAVLVLDSGQLAGIMTERDLMRAFARGLRDDTVVGECMTANPDTIAPDDTIEHAPSARGRWHRRRGRPLYSRPRPGRGRGLGAPRRVSAPPSSPAGTGLLLDHETAVSAWS